jgi:Zn ribbon nucleic-acid-binding protein
MAECPQCQSDADLRMQRRDGDPGYECGKCGTWVQFGALPPSVPTRSRAQAHKASPGRWPEDLPLDAKGQVEEGLVVRSKSGDIEGRTTGPRSRCTSISCPGWVIAITWETGQALKVCSEGWQYDAGTKAIQITGGGEISGRFISPPPLGVDPLPKGDWPARSTLEKRKGWRVPVAAAAS